MVAALLAAALACPAQPALLERRRGGVLRTAVVACDGNRRVVVRRARLARGRGTRIRQVLGAGSRVAWIERLRMRRRAIDEVRVRRIAGGRAQVVAHGDLSFLRLDDDRTLRWWDWYRETWRFHDLRRWRGPGCPARSHFHAVAESADVVAYEGDYGFEGDPVDIVRACVRASGHDPVIAQAFQSVGNGDTLYVAGVDRDWVVLVRVYTSRYDGCSSTVVEVVDAASLRHGRGAGIGCDAGRLPLRGAPMVVSEHGAPAWIVRDATASRLVTAAGRGTIELDSGGPDTITGLVASGPAVRWLHDGAPRSVVLD
jgi:hypothetical protein